MVNARTSPFTSTEKGAAPVEPRALRTRRSPVHPANTRPDGGRHRHQQDIFGKELPDQPASTRADRQPDGDLALPGRGARQQQVGGVRARNEQDECRHAEEREERRGEPGAKIGEALTERLDGQSLLQEATTTIRVADALCLLRDALLKGCAQRRDDALLVSRPMTSSQRMPSWVMNVLLCVRAAVAEVLRVVDLALHHQGNPQVHWRFEPYA